MVVGFLAYSTLRMFTLVVVNRISRLIMVFSMLATYYLFKTPWIFPSLIVLGGIVSNFTNKKELPEIPGMPRKIKWGNIVIFFAILIIAGLLSEVARKQQWENRKAYNLFENFYRFGSLVFGEAGEKTLRFEVTGKHPRSEGYLFVLDFIDLVR